MDKTSLVETLGGADVCLGVFGAQEQARITVPNKVYEGLALAKPVVTRDSPPARRQFRDGEHVLFVPPEDPPALAAAILRLREDDGLRARLSACGHRLFRARYTTKRLGEMARGYVEEAVEQYRASDQAAG
jgi:glycosyltransferase involved in cell wall biosynthesis